MFSPRTRQKMLNCFSSSLLNQLFQRCPATGYRPFWKIPPPPFHINNSIVALSSISFFFFLFLSNILFLKSQSISFLCLYILSFLLFFSPPFLDIIIWKKRSDVQDAWATWKFNPIPSLFLGRVSLSLYIYLFLVGRVCRIKCYYYYQQGYYIASYPSVPESC